jgi:signal transduction histidine kinase
LCESCPVIATPDRPASRTRTPYWVSVFVATTVLLAVLAAGRVAEHRRVEENYVASAHASAAKMAADFAHHLDQLAEDAHLLAEQFWQPGQKSDYPQEIRTRVLADGVRVLASAVHHCRGVIFSQNGRDFEVALDPAEDPALVPWLKEQGRKAFSAPHASTRLLGPMNAPGDRPFFVQAQNLPFGMVLAAVDARRLFETLQHGRPADARFVLVDSAETLWAGCGSFATCQSLTRAEWSRDPEFLRFMSERNKSEDTVAVPLHFRRLLSLPATADMAVHWSPLETGDAPLSLGFLTPLTALQTHRQAERWRMVATVAALLLSAGIVVGFLWRQREQELALHESLCHAEKLNRLEHQLVRAEKLASVGALTAGLAHELGTPLAIIRGRAEILEERTQWPEIKTILEQSDRIASTLRQVLDFSREQPVAMQPTDAVSAFRTIASLLNFRLRPKQIRLQIEPAEGALFIAADPDQLQQVLVNLVMNACDACQEDGTITLRARREPASPGFIRLDVTDDGCGIPPDKLDAVFDPFFTTKPKGEGTGLGLPVAASIVRNHQGQISITSTEGQGTTVSILWPQDNREDNKGVDRGAAP